MNDLQSEFENSQKEARGYSAELFRVKAQVEEAHDSMDALRRENKNLAGEASFFWLNFYTVLFVIPCIFDYNLQLLKKQY